MTEPGRKKEQVALALMMSHPLLALFGFLLIINFSEHTFESEVEKTGFFLQYPCEGSRR